MSKNGEQRVMDRVIFGRTVFRVNDALREREPREAGRSTRSVQWSNLIG
jgi:hypothetical protein